MRSLHDVMKIARQEFKDWQVKNPYDHPAKLHKLMAEFVVDFLKRESVSGVYAIPSVINGGSPEYTQALAYCKENGIEIYQEKVRVFEGI